MNRITARSILVIGGLGAVIYGFPGYLNNESALQLGQARTGHYDDAVPPLMARYWHFTDQLYHGQLPMLLLQIALLLWGARGLLATRFSPRASAIAAVALLWFFPVLAPMVLVCKEAQMAGWLLAGTMLMLRPSARARTGGLVMLIVGSGVCGSAAWAIAPLVILVVRNAAIRGFLRTVMLSVLLVAGVIGISHVIDRHYTDRAVHPWERATASHDLAGTLCYAPHMTDSQVESLLAGLALQKHEAIQGRFCNGWSPRHPLTNNPETSIFDLAPTNSDLAARGELRWRLIRRFPGAFATQRWKVMQELVGLGRVPPDDAVIQTYWGTEAQGHRLFTDAKPSNLQHWIGGWVAAWATTMWFRPWVYFVVGLVVLGIGVARRDGLVTAIAASGLLSELHVALNAVDAQYRFSSWSIICTALAVLLVLGRLRWRG